MFFCTSCSMLRSMITEFPAQGYELRIDQVTSLCAQHQEIRAIFL